MRGASRRAAPEFPRRRRIDGLAVRSWMLPRVQAVARANRKIGGRGEDRQWYGGPDASFFAGKPFRFSGIRGVTGTHRGVRDLTKEQGGVKQRDAVAPGPPAKVSG